MDKPQVCTINTHATGLFVHGSAHGRPCADLFTFDPAGLAAFIEWRVPSRPLHPARRIVTHRGGRPYEANHSTSAALFRGSLSNVDSSVHVGMDFVPTPVTGKV